MRVYGKDFASVYNDKWAFWGPKMCPFLLKTVKRSNPIAKNWLDLCCGAGSLLKLICENGFSAVGVDFSSHQLKYANINAPGAKLIKQDIRHLHLPYKFDVITCMFDSLNYLIRTKELTNVFRKVRKYLNHNGCFIFDMNTFDGLQDCWCRTSTIREPNRTIIVETSFDPESTIGRCLITGFIKEWQRYRKFEEEHIEKGYRPEEIEECLCKAGFNFKKYDGNSLSRPKKKSARLLYVCYLKTI